MEVAAPASHLLGLTQEKSLPVSHEAPLPCMVLTP